ncbi:MAG: hypothetical protein WCS66_09330 [Bacteroidales bacterium]
MEGKISYRLGSIYYDSVKGKSIRKRMSKDKFIEKVLNDIQPSFFIPKLTRVTIYEVDASQQPGIIVELQYETTSTDSRVKKVILKDLYAYGYFYRSIGELTSINLEKLSFITSRIRFNRKDLSKSVNIEGLISILKQRLA